MRLLKTTFTALLLFQVSLFADLSAVGYGENEKSAKNAALSELSNQVSANVKSSLSTSTTIKEGKVTKDANKQLNVASNTYFQGVTYSTPTKEGGMYQVTAYLDKAGIANTLSFLQKELHKDLLKLSNKELKELLHKSEMAYALANFSLEKEPIQIDVKAQEDEIQKHLSYAQVTFNIQPSTAKVTVDDEPYELFKTYLLSASKRYHFEIKADGFYTEDGMLSFGKGEKRTIAKQLIKQTNSDARVFVDVKSDVPEFKDSATGLLLKYGLAVSPSSKATNCVRFSFDRQFVTEVSGMKVYTVTVVMNVYKGTSKIMVKQVKRKNVVDANYIEKVNASVIALTKYLLTKQDMKTFIGKESVNYDDI